jgi:hypothetical protein
MPDQPISPLRQRMIDDMTARRFGEDTQRDYVRAVKNFAAYLGCSPHKASAEDLRRYQLRLAKQHISRATINQTCSALQDHVGKARPRPASGTGAAAAQDAGRPEPGRGGASHRSRTEPQVQGRAQRRLRRRPSGVGDREVESVRHPRIKSGDQRAHDAAGRTRQGAARAVRDAVAAAARNLARVVACRAASSSPR